MKTCWICHRTEKDLIDEGFKGEREWVKNQEFNDVFMCPICNSCLCYWLGEDNQERWLLNTLSEALIKALDEVGKR